jgi:hypothetical protein
MSGEAFDLIEQAARTGDANSALDLLVTICRDEENYSLLFQARLMLARYKIGLPLILNDSLDDLPQGKRQSYDEAMREAAREAGSLFLAEGDILRAWPYFRALGDAAPVSAAIEKIESHDQLDGIIEIAFGQGVHPRKGFELLLEHYGICRAISVFQQYPDPKSRDQCARLLVRTLHRELVDNLKHAISRTEGHQPAGSTVPELIRGRDWLFGDMDSYVDTAHLTAVIPLALDFTDPDALELVLELCEYGAHLSSKFQYYRTEPPFDDFYNDHAIYLRALLGRDIDAAVAHFRNKVAPRDGDAATTGPVQILVMLLVRLKRYRDAVAVSLEYLSEQHPDELACPTISQLCQMAGDYDSLRDLARRRGDLLSFTAAAIHETHGTARH